MDNERSNGRSGKRSKCGNPAVAIGYVRVSTAEQHLGPEAQRAAIETWARREGVTLAGWCSDLGVSGAAPLDARPGVLAALDALALHGAGLLVVAKRDRLARDVLSAALLEQLVAKAGAAIVSAAGEGTGDDPGARLQRGIVDLFAEYERGVIRARTKAALRAKRARGERAGNVPFGYSADASGRLEPNASELAIVERVRALRVEGRTLRAIVAVLEAEGVRGRTGRPLALRQVARLVGVDPARTEPGRAA